MNIRRSKSKPEVEFCYGATMPWIQISLKFGLHGVHRIRILRLHCCHFKELYDYFAVVVLFGWNLHGMSTQHADTQTSVKRLEKSQRT